MKALLLLVALAAAVTALFMILAVAAIWLGAPT
jgi:hypothetical protein